MPRARLLAGLAFACVAGCGVIPNGPGAGAGLTGVFTGPLLLGAGPCAIEEGPFPLPPEVPESSGAAAAFVAGGGAGVADVARRLPPSAPATAGPGETSPGAFWTHNDAGFGPELFLVRLDGALLERVSVAGAANVDWEDLAWGPCSDPDAASVGRCLYVADTGDNAEVRDEMAVYRIRTAGRVERLPIRLPHGPRDIEAFLVPADGHGLFVTKGRRGPIEVYRTRHSLGEAAGGRPLSVERIQELTERAPFLPRMVTGGAASPDGTLAALRTYETLRFYRIDPDGRLVAIDGGLVNLRPLREPQGEGVAFLTADRIVLTSEAGPGRRRGQGAVLRCEIRSRDGV